LFSIHTCVIFEAGIGTNWRSFIFVLKDNFIAFPESNYLFEFILSGPSSYLFHDKKIYLYTRIGFVDGVKFLLNLGNKNEKFRQIDLIIETFPKKSV